MNEDMEIQKLMETIREVGSRCWNCNFCFSACPNFESTRGFQVQGPSGILQSIYHAIKWEDKVGESDKEALRDIVYACTTCRSCEITCKKVSAGVPILELIETGRKYLLETMVGPLPEQRNALDSIYKYGNPYGESPEKRLSWLGDMEVKRLPGEQEEVLYYVGCTASYEPELHNLARSLVKLFRFLKVDFGVLEGEVCCGDPVRSLGDEFLFQEMIGQNVEKFKASGVKSIVTISPHCFNAFSKKYEGLEEAFQIRHYTEFLASVFEEKKPKFPKELPYTVTYHDPCYLGKHNDIYDAPRELIQAIPGVELKEMAMNRQDSLCCGGGGGRMYAEVEEERRLADVRLGQALEIGADVVATACPWCHTMLANAVKDLRMEEKIRVLDVAELLAEALGL
ncbi:MAG: (Fe-S)-binding protein [Methanosarcinaceae archaeon]|nr:(Fe-S)-binding protein [Methanosarcinaceae archaeon]